MGIAFLIASASYIFINVTFAFFTVNQTTANTKNMGTIAVSSTSISNPFTFNGNGSYMVPVDINNLSNVSVCVRAFVQINWLNDEPLKTVNTILKNSDWTLGSDFYYYYNFIVPESGQTGDTFGFLDSIEFVDEDVDQIGQFFEIKVYVEAVQYVNNGYVNLWTTAPASWISILS